MKKISVIIPCYNVEAYIDKCVESLINQTFGIDNMELICVDDASADNTYVRLCVWEKKYSNSILVIRCEGNQKQGAARNIGLKYASADYIGFVDGDDWIEPDMYELLYNKAAETGADFVTGFYQREDTYGKVYYNGRKYSGVTGKLCEAPAEGYCNFPGGIVCGLFSKKIIVENDICFPEQLAYEDNFWGAIMKYYIHTYYVIDKIIYHYIINPQSTTIQRNADRYKDRLLIEKMKLAELKRRGFYEKNKHNIEFDFLKFYYINTLHIIFTRMDNIPYDILWMMQREVRGIIPEFEKNPHLNRLNWIEEFFLKTARMQLSEEDWNDIKLSYLSDIQTANLTEQYVIKEGEQQFIVMINKMLGELQVKHSVSECALEELRTVYHSMTDEEKEHSISLVYKEVEAHYYMAIVLMKTLLFELKDKKIVHYIQKLLADAQHPLWARLNDMSQLSQYLFMNIIFEGEYENYVNQKVLYKNILNEIENKISFDNPYIPYKQRRRKIIIVMSQVLSIYHAPTKRMKFIYDSYKNMGYDVECYICHLEGVEGGWNGTVYYNNNLLNQTGEFAFLLDGMEVEGYNLKLDSSRYIEQLQQTAQRIWREKPEFVLEIGSKTLLASLCSRFTTLVTMGCTKTLPVTNAPIIATPVEHSKEEKQMWKTILEDSQMVLEIKHLVNGKNQGEEEVYTKKDFGIPEDAFVILVAGNRLDGEIQPSFVDILYETLKIDKHFVIAVVGTCPNLKNRIREGDMFHRFYFLDWQPRFREVVAIGDVFLNPPRQGGGTGGLFAMMMEVPVITLDNCDVEVNSGPEFVCESVEEMPKLVHRYFTDQEFMRKQKENCRKQAMAKNNIDNEKNSRRLCEAVKKYAISQEELRNDTF